jgi:hypothetical protein
MAKGNFTISFSVDQSPKEVFVAIWSGEIGGATDKLGPSSRTVTKACTVPSKRSRNSFRARESSGT